MQKSNVRIEVPADWREAGNQINTTGRHDSTSARSMRIRRLVPAVDALNAIAASLPTSYGWRFITAENFTRLFEARALAGASVGELNALYWRDTLATIEAYTVMSVWRMIDICQSAFRCIQEAAVVPAAILARSALESSVQFVQDARTISASLEPVLKIDLNAGLATSTELEKYLLQTVYAARQTGSDEIYKSKNILTVLEKIAKVAKDEPIREEYELLCEVTHPNFLGRSTYITGAEDDRGDGSELRILSPENGIGCDALLQSVIWALSWAIEAQAQSTLLVQGVVQDLFNLLPQPLTRH